MRLKNMSWKGSQGIVICSYSSFPMVLPGRKCTWFLSQEMLDVRGTRVSVDGVERE